jgi:hypothetical protein
LECEVAQLLVDVCLLQVGSVAPEQQQQQRGMMSRMQTRDERAHRMRQRAEFDQQVLLDVLHDVQKLQCCCACWKVFRRAACMTGCCAALQLHAAQLATGSQLASSCLKNTLVASAA